MSRVKTKEDVTGAPMRAMRVATLFAMPIITGCSHQHVYELIRQNRLDACERNHAAAVQECRRAFPMAYEEYRQVLRDLDKAQ
jgi:hypothetical protein